MITKQWHVPVYKFKCYRWSRCGYEGGRWNSPQQKPSTKASLNRKDFAFSLASAAWKCCHKLQESLKLPTPLSNKLYQHTNSTPHALSKWLQTILWQLHVLKFLRKHPAPHNHCKTFTTLQSPEPARTTKDQNPWLHPPKNLQKLALTTLLIRGGINQTNTILCNSLPEGGFSETLPHLPSCSRKSNTMPPEAQNLKTGWKWLKLDQRMRCKAQIKRRVASGVFGEGIWGGSDTGCRIRAECKYLNLVRDYGETKEGPTGWVGSWVGG